MRHFGKIYLAFWLITALLAMEVLRPLNTEARTPDPFLGFVTAGADGNLWFPERSGIGRMTPAGHVDHFPLESLSRSSTSAQATTPHLAITRLPCTKGINLRSYDTTWKAPMHSVGAGFSFRSTILVTFDGPGAYGQRGGSICYASGTSIIVTAMPHLGGIWRDTFFTGGIPYSAAPWTTAHGTCLRVFHIASPTHGIPTRTFVVVLDWTLTPGVGLTTKWFYA